MKYNYGHTLFMFMRAKRLATIRILTEIICNNLAQYYPHHLIDRENLRCSTYLERKIVLKVVKVCIIVMHVAM